MIFALPFLYLQKKFDNLYLQVALVFILFISMFLGDQVLAKVIDQAYNFPFFVKTSLFIFFVFKLVENKITISLIAKSVLLLLFPLFVNFDFISLPLIGAVTWLVLLFFDNEGSRLRSAALLIFPILLLLNEKINFFVLGTSVDIANRLFYQTLGYLEFLPFISSALIIIWLLAFSYITFEKSTCLLDLLFLVLIKERIFEALVLSKDTFFGVGLFLIILFLFLAVFSYKSKQPQQFLAFLSFILNPWLMPVAFVLDILPILKSKLKNQLFMEYLPVVFSIILCVGSVLVYRFIPSGDSKVLSFLILFATLVYLLQSKRQGVLK